MVSRQGSVESEPVDLDEEEEEDEDWVTMRVAASPGTAGPRPVMRRDMPICWLGTGQKCAIIIFYQMSIHRSSSVCKAKWRALSARSPRDGNKCRAPRRGGQQQQGAAQQQAVVV